MTVSSSATNGSMSPSASSWTTSNKKPVSRQWEDVISNIQVGVTNSHKKDNVHSCSKPEGDQRKMVRMMMTTDMGKKTIKFRLARMFSWLQPQEGCVGEVHHLWAGPQVGPDDICCWRGRVMIGSPKLSSRNRQHSLLVRVF